MEILMQTTLNQGGKGIRAACMIRAGEVILREKPLLKVSNDIFEGPVDVIDERLTKQLDRMSSKDREIFFNLIDSHDSAALFPLWLGSHRLPGFSCNRRYTPGKEINVSYLPSLAQGTDIKKIRQHYLKYWYHFDCTCNICVMDNTKVVRNDRLRRKIKIVQARLEDVMCSFTIDELNTFLDNLNLIRGVKIPYLLNVLEKVLENALELNDIKLASKLIVRGGDNGRHYWRCEGFEKLGG
ncbi:SMYD [Lepeophtheirus salmonis]|uniref:SMYD n=1 Tax=Lepeophtheirus salmonis TaxID=72036 RepID=A0A7R8H0P3_LEPSM|nr:SMYD [Lepeophtheirus salmonis]CAF2793361.1 SMYD [Lepeophtheirus salmonis]